MNSLLCSALTLHKTSLMGLRPSNEDVEEYLLNLFPNGAPKNKNLPPIDIFIVCDGHGGSQVSKYIAPKLLKNLAKINNVYPLNTNFINSVYEQLNNNLKKHTGMADECGCTAIVVIRYIDHKLNKECLQIINLGDCRAILSRKGMAISLSKDHKPYWPEEKKRIDACNKKYGLSNTVHFQQGDWRILDLSVSRAFGDLNNPYISKVPDNFLQLIAPYDQFIVIACDGLWDVLENHEVINFISDHLNNNHTEFYKIPHRYPLTQEAVETKNIARKLAEYAIAKNSTDNISIFIIFFSTK